ncbi:MAG TPA: prolipoprotein diacylglyceryl transferase [Anaerolineaceae bacterium]|nr:prolipoprotein diacylglyceryl transferase [Anaerolineaceae bacterium]
MPQGIQIGPIMIRYYALIILAGAMVAAWLATQEAKRHGKDPEMVWDMLPWLLIGGIIGARLWHVLTPSSSNAAMGLTTQYYFQHPLEILKIWKGGLGIFGGIIGGAIALAIYCRANKQNFFEWTDIIAPGLLIAQAIGRWGNFVNQEVYGPPSDLPWAIYIDPAHRLPGFETVERYHPLFLYESLLTLLGGLLLLYIARKYKDKLFIGDLFLMYLVYYPLIRFGLEFIRLDPSAVGTININQTVMLIVGILALLILVLRHTVWLPKAVREVQTEGIDVSEMKLVEPEIEATAESVTQTASTEPAAPSQPEEEPADEDEAEDETSA